MPHPKLPAAVLARVLLNQLLIGEAFEAIAVWAEKEGASELAQKLRLCVGDLRFDADLMDKAIIELIKPDEGWN